MVDDLGGAGGGPNAGMAEQSAGHRLGGVDPAWQTPPDSCATVDARSDLRRSPVRLREQARSPTGTTRSSPKCPRSLIT